jgi:hypothetical protein
MKESVKCGMNGVVLEGASLDQRMCGEEWTKERKKE